MVWLSVFCVIVAWGRFCRFGNYFLPFGIASRSYADIDRTDSTAADLRSAAVFYHRLGQEGGMAREKRAKRCDDRTFYGGINAILRDVMEQTRIAPETLAVRAGLPAATIARWRNGVTHPTLADLRALAGVLGVEVLSLVPATERWHGRSSPVVGS
jgi:hypothetical protein